MPTMRSASPNAATISVFDAKIVTMRCGGSGTVTLRSNASHTVTGSAHTGATHTGTVSASAARKAAVLIKT